MINYNINRKLMQHNRSLRDISISEHKFIRHPPPHQHQNVTHHFQVKYIHNNPSNFAQSKNQSKSHKNLFNPLLFTSKKQ